MRGTRGESGEQHDRERGGWRMAEAPCAVARPGSLFLDIYRAHSKTIDNHTECQFDDEEYLGTRTAPENHSQFPVFQISNNSFWGFGETSVSRTSWTSTATATTMELYRQAREGFYLLCSLLLEPWIISMSALSFPKLPGDVKD